MTSIFDFHYKHPYVVDKNSPAFKVPLNLFISQSKYQLRKSSLKIMETNQIYSDLRCNGCYYYEFKNNESLSKLGQVFSDNFSLQTEMKPLREEVFVYIWNILMGLNGLEEALRTYLGPSSPVIHEACTFRVRCQNSQDQENTSGFWHRDAIGSRLKLFICINQVPLDNAPETWLIPCPHLDPGPRSWEMARAYIKREEGKIAIKNIDEQLSQFNVRKVLQKQYSLLIVDTNCIHKGHYKKSLSNNLNQSRDLIQISIIGNTELDFYTKLNGQSYTHDPISYSINRSYNNFNLSNPPFITKH